MREALLDPSRCDQRSVPRVRPQPGIQDEIDDRDGEQREDEPEPPERRRLSCPRAASRPRRGSRPRPSRRARSRRSRMSQTRPMQRDDRDRRDPTAPESGCDASHRLGSSSSGMRAAASIRASFSRTESQIASADHERRDEHVAAEYHVCHVNDPRAPRARRSHAARALASKRSSRRAPSCPRATSARTRSPRPCTGWPSSAQRAQPRLDVVVARSRRASASHG